MEISGNLFKSIGEVFPGAVIICSVAGDTYKIEYSSPEVPAVLDIKTFSASVSIDDIIDVILPEDRKFFADKLRKCAEEGAAIDVHYRINAGRKTFNWVHAKGRRCNVDEKISVVILSFTNASVESDIYKDLIDNTSSMVYVCDRETYTILYANKVAQEKRFGKSKYSADILCYKRIRGRDKPCEDCFMKRLNENELLKITRYNSANGTWENLSGRFINWCGHKAFVQYIDDVTESETLRTELEKSEKRYETAVEAANLSLWEYDIHKHKIIYGNATFENYGLPSELDNVPESLLQFVPEEEKEKLLEVYRRIDNGEPFVDFEIRMNGVGGKRGTVHRIIYTTEKDENGVPVTAYAVGIDITAQADEREDFQKNIETLITASPESLCTFHFNITCNTCDAAYGTSEYIVKIINSDTVEGVFRNIATIVPSGEERKRFLKVFDRKTIISEFNSGKTHISLDYRRENADGDLIRVRTYLNMLKNPETEDIVGIAYSVDISAQKQQEAINEIITGREYQMVSVLDIHTHMLEAVYLGNGLPETYSSFFEKPGDRCLAEDVNKHSISEWLDPEDKEIYEEGTNIAKHPKKLNGEDHIEFTVRTKPSPETGKVMFRRFQHYWLDDTHDKILVMVADVTKSVERQQEELEKERCLRMDANAANAAKTDFLSRMSHDMRTLLNGIIGMTHIAKEEDNPPKTVDCLHKIDSSSQFMLGIINDILDMSKVESKNFELHTEPYDARKFLGYVNAVIRPVCEEKGQKLLFDCKALDNAVPVMDVLRVNQIFFNLLSNASKYTPEGGTITLRLRDSMTDGGKYAMNAEIIDTGIGMSKEFQKTMFESFTQENRDDNASNHGTGLGLAIVKKLVTLMNGTITVESEAGKGTTIHLNCKFECAPREETLSVKQETINGNFNFGGIHVLLCEDHPLNREIAEALLSEKKMIVKTAENGKKGVDEFALSAPGYYDVILMDIRMPVMDGYKATKAIRGLPREDAKTIPIIAMTADAFADDVQKCLDAGMNAHVSKPIDPIKFFETIAETVRMTNK